MPDDRIGACVHDSSVRTGLNQTMNAVLEVERCPGEQSHSNIQHKQPNEASCMLRHRYTVRKENARGQGRHTCESCHYRRQRLGSKTATGHDPSPSSRRGSPAVLHIRAAFLHLHFRFLSAFPNSGFAQGEASRHAHSEVEPKAPETGADGGAGHDERGKLLFSWPAAAGRTSESVRKAMLGAQASVP